MASREAGGGNLGEGSCSPDVRLLGRAQSGAIIPPSAIPVSHPRPPFGVTATHQSPDASRPGCEGLFLYFPPFRQVTPWCSTFVSTSALNLLSQPTTR